MPGSPASLNPDKLRCWNDRSRYTKITIAFPQVVSVTLAVYANPESQHDALAAAGCDDIFIDKASGKLARRPELDRALLSANRAGDQFVVTKLDRLGRSLEHLIELSRLLQVKGVDLVVLDQGIDTSTAVGRMFFQILGAIAEFEHALMSERTSDGLAAARARGRTGGQKPKLGPRQVKLAREMYDSGDYTVQQIAGEFGVTRPTMGCR